MAMLDMNWQPSDRQLRQFAAISSIALPAVAWLWGAQAVTLGLLLLLAATGGVAGWLWPPLVKPVFLTLSLVAFPLGLVVGEIALLGIYLALFVPLGLLFRIMGRDALHRRLDPGANSYWQARRSPGDVARYFRQY